MMNTTMRLNQMEKVERCSWTSRESENIGFHRTIDKIIDELKRIVVGFTATSGADGGGVIRGKRMM